MAGPVPPAGRSISNIDSPRHPSAGEGPAISLGPALCSYKRTSPVRTGCSVVTSTFPPQVDHALGLPDRALDGVGRDRVDVGSDADARFDVGREIAVAGGAHRGVARLGTRLHNDGDGVEPLD